MRWIRILLYTFLILAALLAGLHFWITSHSKSVLKDFIHNQSNGTLQFDASKVTVLLLERRVEFKDIKLISNASSNSKSEYDITCPSLVFQLQHIRPLIFGKALLIDSIVCNSPSVVLIKKLNQNQKHLKIAEEWGNISKGLQKVLNKLYLNRFQINNASFEMREFGNKNAIPFKINNIYFVIDQFLANNEKKQPDIEAKKIALSIYRQNIVLPNNKQHIIFREFNLNTATGRLLIDSCILFNRTVEDSSSYRITTDTLLLDKINFDTLYETGLIIAKTMLLARPTIDLHLYAKDASEKGKKKSIQEILSKLSGEINLEQFMLEDAIVDIKATQKNKTNRFHLNDVSLKAGDIKIGNDSNINPIDIGFIDLIIKKYQGNNNDSSYIIEMEKLHLKKEEVTISNISMLPTNNLNAKKQNSIYVKEININDLSIPDLLFYKKISANSIQLQQPNIHFVAAAGKPNKHTSKNKLNNIADSILQVINLEIVDGNIHFDNNKGTIVSVLNLHLSSSLSHILTTKDPAALVQKLKHLDFQKLQFKTTAIQLEAEKSDFTSINNDLHFKKIQFKSSDKKIKGVLEQVTILATPLKNEANIFEIRKLKWGKGHFQMLLQKDSAQKHTDKKNSDKSIIVNNIEGNNTLVEFVTSNGKGNTNVKQLKLASVSIRGNEKPELENLFLLAERSNFINANNTISAARLSIDHSQEITLTDVKVLNNKNKDTINAQIPKIHINSNINQIVKGERSIKQLIINDPTLFVKKVNAANKTNTSKKPFPTLDVENIIIKNVAANISIVKDTQANRIVIAQSNFNINNLVANESNISVNKSSAHFNALEFYKNEKLMLKGSPSLEGITFAKKDTTWTGGFDELNIPKSAVRLSKKDSANTIFNWENINIKNIHLTSTALKQKKEWISLNEGAAIDLSKINIETPKQQFYTNRIHSSSLQTLIEIDSFSLKPTVSRDALIESSPWQTEYIQFQASAIKLHHFEPMRFFTDSLFRLQHLALYQPSIDVYRDKQKPFRHGILKPLPTNALKLLKLKLSIDSITTENGTVIYNERSDKTGMVGTVNFTNLNARVGNIINHNYSNTDSLKLRAHTLFMGVTPLQLRLRESYADSLGGFLLSASLAKTELNILNKMIEPAVSVKINSGHLDTLFMRVVGREYLSLGRMNMLYHKLHIEFLNKGKEDKKTFLTGLMTFAANSFVIKTNNKKRKGVIYYTRDREKAVFNYLAKMALSGAASSAGAKSNKKYRKQYLKALKEKDLPPIHLDD